MGVTKGERRATERTKTDNAERERDS